ncbi:helicase [Tenacibaculum phage PTm5]|uniref:Helicase n=1 Tax=Tenacibaculum phage PTm5 TaxID=2547426 RepID=A0A5S9HY47_9CAUD|nr:helicase [Tenacibaculum phage PTm5]
MSEDRKILLPSALSTYEKEQQQQLNFEDLARTDMHFRLRTGADILIEENGIHIQNPFKFSHTDIYKWSESQNENIDVVLQNYSSYFEKVKARYDVEKRLTYRPYITTDGFTDNLDVSGLTQGQKIDKIYQFNKDRIDLLRKTDDSLDAQAEIDHRRNNIFELLYHKHGKDLDNLLLKLYGDDLAISNRVTILQNYRERDAKPNPKNPSEILPANYSHAQRTYTIGEMIEILQSPKLNERDKSDRLLVIPNITGNREVGDIAYVNWSGMQVFDIDLKFSPTFIANGSSAGEIRDILFEKLKHYPWFMGITLSSSGRALHLYTKVSKPHNIFKTPEHNIDISKYWYRMSYVQKYCAICYVLFHHCDIDVYDENERKEKVVDTAMARVQQGIAMNHDPNGKWNNNFIDLPPQLFYHLPPEQGLNDSDWLDLPHVTNAFKNWFYDNAVNDEENEEVTQRVGSMKIIADDSYKLGDISQIDMDSLGKGEKYSTRWRVCNTLIASYGDTPQAKELAYHILQVGKSSSESQVDAFLRSAVMNRKEADVYMIKQLRKLGLQIALDEETTQQLSDDNMERVRFMVEKSNYAFRQHMPNHLVNLADGEYLGMRMNQIVNSFDQFKVNVIESAPNTGKTEFFKALARKKAVCLVIPFTSVIESKVISDESICELFDAYYGDISVSDIKKGRSAVMTIDKFSKLPKSKYKMFDYIAIDESHLLFTSTYRLPVVSMTVENIRTNLLKDVSMVKNSMSSVMSVQSLLNFVEQEETTIELPKIILMTGTITAELDYFKHYDILNYIKVQKKHPHHKKAEFVLSKSAQTRDLLIFKEISEVLGRGGKVIHPTNNGDGYANKVVECVQHILGRKVKWEYYKRANTDETFLERINTDTTVDDLELLFCSDYLSVGIDIKDVDDFEFIYSSDFTAESIEQFNNRLRSTNINSKIFFDVLDADGQQKPNIMNLQQIEYKANAEFQNMISDEETIAKIQQHVGAKSQYYAVIGEMFSKYFVQDMFGNIKYVKSAFEIEQFENAYKNIARSLLYIKTSMELKYQYEVSVSFKEELSENEIEKFKEIQKVAKSEYDLQKSNSMLQIIDFVSSDSVYDVISKRDYKLLKINDELEEDEIGLHLGYNSDEDSFTISYNRKHKVMLEESMKIASKLRKLYSHNTVKAILVSCTSQTSGIIRRIDVYRYMDLMKLMFVDKKQTLSMNTAELLSTAYTFIFPSEGKQKIERWEYEEMKMQMKHKIDESVFNIAETEFKSTRRKENVDGLINKFVDTLFIKRVGRENVNIEFRKIFPFDSETINERVKQDTIFNQLLKDDYTEIDPNEVHDVSSNHINDDIQFMV